MFRFERIVSDSRTLVISPAGPDQEELVLQKESWIIWLKISFM